MGYCYPSGLEKTLFISGTYISPAGHERVKEGESLWLLFLSVKYS